MFKRQGLHLALLALLLAAVALLGGDATRGGSWGGLGTEAWLWISVASAVLHQGFVWLVWRLELHHRIPSRTIGWRASFALYAVGFILLGLARVLTLAGVALPNRGTWTLPLPLRISMTLLAGGLFLVLLYAITRHLGWRRTIGLDHFSPHLERRLVREGLFGVIDNPIYTVGPLVFYLPGVWLGAPAALLAAAFHHAYLWVHWVVTERPDMRRIYGEDVEAG